MGSDLGGAIGMGAGFLLAGPMGGQIGGMIGSVLGGTLFPPDSPDLKTPKMANYAYQNASSGIAVPLIYGQRGKIAGNIIWAGELRRRVKTVKAGKGAGGDAGAKKVTYRQSFLIAICEGRGEVTRIWKNKELMILDEEPVTIFTGDGVNDGLQTLIGEDYAYYKNICCVYFDNYKLGQTSQLPNFTFEVQKELSRYNGIWFGTGSGPFLLDLDGNELVDASGSSSYPYRNKRNDLVSLEGIGASVYLRYSTDYTTKGYWTTSTNTEYFVLPDFDDGEAFWVGSGDDHLYKFHYDNKDTDHTHIYKFDMDGIVGAAAFDKDGNLYVGIGNGSNRGVHKINKTTGAILYTYANWYCRTLVIIGNKLYAGGNVNGGKNVWMWNLESSVVVNSAMHGSSTIYRLVNYNGYLVALGAF